MNPSTSSQWLEATEGDAWVVSFEGIDRDGRDAREVAGFSRAAHQGAARDFSLDGAGSLGGGPSGYQVASPRARVVAGIVLSALLSPVLVIYEQTHIAAGRRVANDAPATWSNATWALHLAVAFVLIFVLFVGLRGLAAYGRRASAATTPGQGAEAPAVPLTDGRFSLRLARSGLSCAGPPGTTPVQAIPMDRIAGFSGDQRLRVKLADGSVTVLPFCLPSHADHAPLAALLDRKLAEIRG
jgi:hypothetical protein